MGISWEYSTNLTGVYLKYYQSIYQTVGIRGSALTIVPFNQGSKLSWTTFMQLLEQINWILPFADEFLPARTLADMAFQLTL